MFASLADDHKSQEIETITSSQMKLTEEQNRDQELSTLRETALTADEAEKEAVCYYVKDDILFRKWRPPGASPDEEWRVVHQIVVPTVYRNDILHMAHDSLLSGHLGIKKTYSRIIQYFYWPKLKRCYRVMQVVSHMSSGRKAKPDYTSSTTTPYFSI